ncbi:MAG: D-aminoacyl-tRNA deacylase [Dehalococcoidia bacterium]
MRAVVQRVNRAEVSVGGRATGSIEQGLLVLLAVGPDDDEETARTFAAKITALRIFRDAEERMNLSLADVGGSVLCVSQFTLYGDVRKGRRPSFVGAAAPELGERLYGVFCAEVERLGFPCGRGRFGAHMEVELVNDGPVTIWLDSDDLRRPRR